MRVPTFHYDLWRKTVFLSLKKNATILGATTRIDALVPNMFSMVFHSISLGQSNGDRNKSKTPFLRKIDFLLT